ncbi:hypothetical protein GCM10027343_36730 [Noviherbaspirillum agri]
MLLLPLHSFAMQGGWYLAASPFDIAHEIDHLAGAGHHHDDDHGSVHYDNSGDSAKHFAEHAAAYSCVTLPSTELPQLTMTVSSAAIPEAQHYLPDPFPERLQRPPSLLG